MSSSKTTFFECFLNTSHYLEMQSIVYDLTGWIEVLLDLVMHREVVQTEKRILCRHLFPLEYCQDWKNPIVWAFIPIEKMSRLNIASFAGFCFHWEVYTEQSLLCGHLFQLKNCLDCTKPLVPVGLCSCWKIV